LNDASKYFEKYRKYEKHLRQKLYSL